MDTNRQFNRFELTTPEQEASGYPRYVSMDEADFVPVLIYKTQLLRDSKRVFKMRDPDTGMALDAYHPNDLAEIRTLWQMTSQACEVLIDAAQQQEIEDQENRRFTE